MAKLVFVTGGVASSVGKGIAVASIGRLLKSRGLAVAIMKLDPYINVDPGTMSPYQHGEVFVTDDGAETDLDLGHYERFTDESATQASNVTTGQVYAAVIGKERRGEYLGGTIQVIPHITNEIKSRIHALARSSSADVVICEVGGTVGDIEGEPFLEAIRQMRTEVGRDDVLYIHVTLLPYIGATKELKTKPTQHSVKELLRAGIQPDIILCRSDFPVSDEIRSKIALFCNIQQRAVIPLVTASTIYEVPLMLESAGMGDYLVETLRLEKAQAPDLSEWRELVERIGAEKPVVRIGLVGKYVALHDAYLSVAEALRSAGWANDVDVEIEWINSESLETHWEEYEPLLASVDGIIVPGGFGHRGIEGKVKAAQLARTKQIPYLGLCLGLQVAVVEFARHVLNLEHANSSEFDPEAPDKVIDLMLKQRNIADKGGTMRLGQWVCCLTPGSKAEAAYDKPIVFERHRHRYEFNNDYRKAMEAKGMALSGKSGDGQLVEIIELRDHPWFVATQFHPEFKSRPNRAHPLFREFVAAATRRAGIHAPRASQDDAADDSRATAHNGHIESATADRSGRAH
ncbi:MAG: CTP synthase [Ktedonobacterales bacterium]|jgi:CTP synthase|nr:MAG: CTP synthase [Ktedonobacterales bacterium]